ncbi:MAG: response regulator, partial [Nitrospirota bacterium]
MDEIKYDIKRGADIYRAIYGSRLKSWISTGQIKRGEVLVWRSGLSGWRKAEELEELRPFFEQWEKDQVVKGKRQIRPALPQKMQVKNILIIDDEKDMCWLLSDALSRNGHNIAIANTKEEGLACLKKEAPDLVLLDLKLPDGDGMSLISKIKEINQKTVVIVIS